MLGRWTYSASGALEESHLLGGGLKVLGRDDSLEDLGGDVPELLVLGAKEDDDAVGLGVEAAGHVEHGLFDDLLDALGADREVLAQDVVAAASLDEVEDRIGGDGSGLLLGAHFCGG